MKEFWNDRYSQDEFAYGEEPSVYLKAKLPLLKAGKALFPAEGEGRNAVFTASLNWEVSAFDFSDTGKAKADKLASSKQVSIDYKVQGFLEESYKAESFDLIGLISVHFEPDMKLEMHKRLDAYLKVGGYMILDAFSKEHREINKINPEAGGPPDERMMYSIEEIRSIFKNYDFLELKKEYTELKEGFGHIGRSSVIRFLAQKTSSLT